MNKPFTIPKSEVFDYHKTGFYSYKNKDDFNLRIQESTVELDGIIRLNKNESNNEPIFEGFNGTKWVQFNAEKGDTGEKGDDYNNQFQFINCSDNNNNNNNHGLVYKERNYSEKDKTTTIQLRTLKSGLTSYNNGQMNLNTMNISTEENSILLKALPQPYNWDISQLSIQEMKSKSTDKVFKCYGEMVTIKVKKDTRIEKGQFVSFEEENGYLVCSAFSNITNNNSCDIFNNNSFTNPYSVIGVALEDSSDKEKIKICKEGITTVKYNNISSMIDDNLMDIGSVSKIGCNGLLSNNGYVFCSPIQPVIGINYINVGYFLEISSINDNDYYLFNVKL